MSLEECRRAHDHRAHVRPDRSRDHVGFQTVAETYPRIKTASHHVDQGVAFDDLKADIRILLEELADDRQEHQLTRLSACCYAQVP
ncbi:hypothetical protein D9M73_271140 [compost metagenome]